MRPLPSLPAVFLIALGAVPATAQSPAPPAVPALELRGYVYVEPFEIRRELTVPLARIADGADLPDALDSGTQATVLETMREQLTNAFRVSADGEPLLAEVSELRFLTVDPELGPVPDERELIPLEDAVLGAVFASSRQTFPRTVVIEWTLFPADGEGAATVPVDLEVMSGAEVHVDTLTFTPAQTGQDWTLPEVGPPPALRAITDVTDDQRRGPYIAAGLLGLAAVGLLTLAGTGRVGNRPSLVVSAMLAIVLAGGIGYDAMARPTAGRVTERQAQGIVEGLLANIYHAFAFRDESLIFDTLAASVDGPLLEELYLDIRRGFELAEAGGARVKVLRVSMIDCAVLPSNDGSLRARVVWASAGDVSHWGHTHRRRNQYRGELLIRPVDGRWKVTVVDILSEERT